MNKKEQLRRKRHRRIRLKLRGSADRPRLVVHKSLKNMQAIFVDDIANKILFSCSTLDKKLKDQLNSCGNIKAAELFGTFCAACAKEKGFSKVVFDRAGYLYHGRIKAFADSLRKQGLEF